MLPPAATGLGTPLSVTVRSQASRTLVTTVVLLLAEMGSAVVAETEEFAVIVATETLGATFTTTMISAEVPEARFGSVQVTDVVTVQVHPAGAETETNVVFAGIDFGKTHIRCCRRPVIRHGLRVCDVISGDDGGRGGCGAQGKIRLPCRCHHVGGGGGIIAAEGVVSRIDSRGIRDHCAAGRAGGHGIDGSECPRRARGHAGVRATHGRRRTSPAWRGQRRKQRSCWQVSLRRRWHPWPPQIRCW